METQHMRRPVPFPALLRAMALRDFAPHAIAPAAIVCCFAGIVAGSIGAAMPALSSGSAQMLTAFDRTVAGAFVLLAIFALIRRTNLDMHADWLLQLVSAGASRIAYVASVGLSVGVTCLLLYLITIASFGFTMIARGAGEASLARVPGDAFAFLLMIAAATSFAAAVVTVFRRSAAMFAAAAIALPWLLFATGIISRGVAGVSIAAVHAADLLPPRLFIDISLRGVAHQFIYIALTAGIAILFANQTIARVP